MDEGEFACPLGPTVRLTARPPERLFRLVLESHHGRAPGADSEEKHEPASDIDTVAVDSLKALDPEWPIREADFDLRSCYVAEVPILLQKSFCTRDQNFFWLYRRLPCKYVGDLIIRRKTRWRPR